MSSSISAPLQTTYEGAVARITLTQPDIRNAFSDEVIAAITAAFAEVGRRPEVRAVVLAAQGPAFCAGANLNWMRRMADYTRDENIADAGTLAEMLRVIYECPKPTVVCVQGDAYAGGVGLVAACDIAVAATTAHFCLSEVRIGLIPATISPYVLRAMGTRAAQRYFLSAERFDAAEAHRIGLVHEVVAPEALDARVQTLAHALTQGAPGALAQCKRLVCEVAGQPITAALRDDTVRRIATIRTGAEAREGLRAFVEKRKPNWLIPDGETT